jgi:hypothetical protein
VSILFAATASWKGWTMSLEEIESAIRALDKQSQQKLLHDLPRLLEIRQNSFALLKVAESSFEFWDNSEDAIYDEL